MYIYIYIYIYSYGQNNSSVIKINELILSSLNSY